MITGVVGFSGITFDDDPFRTPRVAAYFGVHIVLAIAAWGKATLAILKLTPSNIAWERFAVPGLELCQ